MLLIILPCYTLSGHWNYSTDTTAPFPLENLYQKHQTEDTPTIMCCLHTWWESPPLCPVCPSNTGCKKNALGELPECEAATTSQTSLWPVGVSYMLDNTCIQKIIFIWQRQWQKWRFDPELGRRCELLPRIMFSKCLHGCKELDAFSQSHSGFLFLGLQHALVLLIGLNTIFTLI